MRIIGGKARRRRLKVPKGLALRPTADRVKEALFNILPNDLSGCRVLDLFAGTGNLTIEALSRGASEALLIDSARQARRAIEENLKALELWDRARIWQAPVIRALRLLSRRRETFHLIFLDPPYEKRLVGSTLQAIARGELLETSGIVVAEHSVKEIVENHYGPLRLDDQRRYGATLISFFRRGYDDSKNGEI